MEPRLSYVRKSTTSQTGGMMRRGRNGFNKSPESTVEDRIALQNLMAMRRGHGRQFDRRLSMPSFQSGGRRRGRRYPCVYCGRQKGGYGGGENPNQEGGYGGGEDPTQEGGQIFSNTTLQNLGIKPIHDKYFWQRTREAVKHKQRLKNKKGGIFPAVAAAVPVAALIAKTIGLGALAGGAGFGAKKALEAI